MILELCHKIIKLDDDKIYEFFLHCNSHTATNLFSCK